MIRAVADKRGCALAVPDFAALAVGPLEGAAWGGATAAGEVAGGGAAATAAGEVAGTSTDGTFAGALTAVRRFTYRGEAFATRMLGRYQPANAAVAIEAVGVLRERGWAISEASLKEGIAAARWPGRFEVVGTSPLTIVDGGHNPQGAVALADSLADGLGPTGRGSVVFAMGVLADKDYPAMVAAVAPWARALVAYAPANPRALPADDLAACARDAGIEAEVAPDPAAALARARDRAGASGVAVAFGTLYAIADLRLEQL